MEDCKACIDERAKLTRLYIADHDSMIDHRKNITRLYEMMLDEACLSRAATQMMARSLQEIVTIVKARLL